MEKRIEDFLININRCRYESGDLGVIDGDKITLEREFRRITINRITEEVEEYKENDYNVWKRVENSTATLLVKKIISILRNEQAEFTIRQEETRNRVWDFSAKDLAGALITELIKDDEETYIKAVDSFWGDDREVYYYKRIEHKADNETIHTLDFLSPCQDHTKNRVLCLSANVPYINLLKETATASGLDYRYFGRSGFSARNSFVVTGFPKRAVNVSLEVVLASGGEYRDPKVIVRKINEAIEVVDSDTINNFYYPVRERYINEVLEEKINSAIIKELTTDDCKVFKYGGETGLDYRYLEDNYILLFDELTKYTQDHRQGITHECMGFFIRKDNPKDRITVKVPSKYAGQFIGKGGRNIKKIEDNTGKKISLVVVED